MQMVLIIKILVKIIKIMITLGKFGFLDEVLSKLEDMIPAEYE